VHNLGQGAIQDDLETLFFDLGDMHRPTLNMKENMEFEKGLIVKQILEILQSGKLRMLSCVLTFETITF
jgi:hypothetical protein